MRVYVVFRGSYSDRMAVEAFDNDEAAQRYCAILNAGEDPGSFDRADIETFELLSEPPDERPGTPRGVTAHYLYVRKGYVYGPNHEYNSEDIGGETAFLQTGEFPPPAKAVLSESGDPWHLVVSGTDKKRVDKVYGERKAQLIARLEGIA